MESARQQSRREDEKGSEPLIPRAVTADVSYGVVLISAYRVSVFLLCMILLLASVDNMLNEFSLVLVFGLQLITLQTSEYAANNPAVAPGTISAVAAMINVCLSVVFDVRAVAKILECRSLDESKSMPVICADTPKNGSNYAGLGWLVVWVSFYTLTQLAAFFTSALLAVNRYQHSSCKCFSHERVGEYARTSPD